jgi:large subunit ribosomal protein L25
MEKVSLEAEIREKTGKGSSGRLRRTGYIPAILYGGKEVPQSLIVNIKDMKKALSTEAGENVIISLKVGDKTRTVIVKDLQTDPVKGDLLHVDLYQISLKERLKASVPIEVRGEAPGVKEGGILQHRLREIEVECLPTEIPEFIPVDVSGLSIGDSLHVKDLRVTGDLKILAAGEESVISVVPPTVEEVAPPTPEEAAAEPEVIGEEKEAVPEEAEEEAKKKPAPPPKEAKEVKPPVKEEKKPEKTPKAEEKKR